MSTSLQIEHAMSCTLLMVQRLQYTAVGVTLSIVSDKLLHDLFV